MSALSQMERAAFVLRHFEGQSIDEISRALGLKTNATKHSIFRAVRKMRARARTVRRDARISRTSAADSDRPPVSDNVGNHGHAASD